jgi:hypothetical protein
MSRASIDPSPVPGLRPSIESVSNDDELPLSPSKKRGSRSHQKQRESADEGDLYDETLANSTLGSAVEHARISISSSSSDEELGSKNSSPEPSGPARDSFRPSSLIRQIEEESRAARAGAARALAAHTARAAPAAPAAPAARSLFHGFVSSDDDEPLVPLHSSRNRPRPLGNVRPDSFSPEPRLASRKKTGSSPGKRAVGSAKKSSLAAEVVGRAPALRSAGLATPSKIPVKDKKGGKKVPTPRRTPVRERGALRNNTCLGCLKSALAGRSKGECYENTTQPGRRCYRCVSGHSCLPIPQYAALTAAKFLDEIRKDQPRPSVSLPLCWHDHCLCVYPACFQVA